MLLRLRITAVAIQQLVRNMAMVTLVAVVAIRPRARSMVIAITATTMAAAIQQPVRNMATATTVATPLLVRNTIAETITITVTQQPARNMVVVTVVDTRPRVKSITATIAPVTRIITMAITGIQNVVAVAAHTRTTTVAAIRITTAVTTGANHAVVVLQLQSLQTHLSQLILLNQHIHHIQRIAQSLRIHQNLLTVRRQVVRLP